MAIASLELDGTPRLDGQSEAHVRLLAETDAVLPPILVHKGSMRVIDGAHRVRAAQVRGEERITAVFFEGSEDDAFLSAVAQNTAHGLPLTLADRRAATERIVRSHPQLSDGSIARTTGLSAKTVAVIRRTLPDLVRPSARTGRDGRVRPLDNSSGRRMAAQLITATPDERGRHLLRLLSQRAVTRSELHAAVEGFPHCSITVSRLAHACAKVWLEFARELDRRAGAH